VCVASAANRLSPNWKIYTLIAAAELNEVDPQAWLADVLVRLPDYPARRIGDLLPWNWYAERRAAA
jgi:transposase